MNALVEALTEFIQTEVVIEDITIEEDTDLLLTGAVDSLGMIRITHWIEEQTGSAVDPGDVTLDNFQTVSKIGSYLDSQSGS